MPYHMHNMYSASASVFLGLFFYPEDGGTMFLRNIGLSETNAATRHYNPTTLLFIGTAVRT
jgi:hypothetical protein